MFLSSAGFTCQVAQDAMQAAKARRDLVTAVIDKKKVELAAFGSPAPAPLKRCRSKRTPAKQLEATPSTKTPDPKATKIATDPGSAKKSLFRDLLAIMGNSTSVHGYIDTL